jgi:uncharacterized membrane protein
MKRRPLPISIIGWLFLAAGIVGLVYHSREFRQWTPFQYDVALVCIVRLIAIVASLFLLRGHNWARWLLVVWIAYHVILSGLHSAFQAIVHSVLLAVIAYFLFRRAVAPYFCRSESQLKASTC